MNKDYEDGSQLITKMCSAADALNSYSSHYKMVVYKQHPPTVEAGTISFQKPHLIRVEIQKGPKKGAVAILTEKGKIHGHLGGPLQFFWGTVSTDSELARTVNNYPMAETDFSSLTKYLHNMLVKGDSCSVSKEPIQTSKTSSPTYLLEIYSPKPETKLLKRIYVDPKTFLPVYWEDYINGNIWTESSWNDLKINISFPKSFFKS